MRAASGKDTRGGEGQAPSVYRLEGDTGQAEREREGGAREGEGPGGPVGRRPLTRCDTPPLLPSEDGAGGEGQGHAWHREEASGHRPEKPLCLRRRQDLLPRPPARPAAHTGNSGPPVSLRTRSP